MASEYGKNVWWNGSFMDLQDAKVSIATHSLHYGGAIFEGVRIYNSKPFLLKEHIDRLFISAEVMRYNMKYNKEEICEAAIKLIDLEGFKDGYIRPIIWLGDEDMKIMGQDSTLHTAIMTCKILEKSDINDDSLKLSVSRWKRAPLNCLPYSSKAAGLYMMYSLIKREAQIDGFDDSIILDENDNITEATTSNFFAISDKELLTPKKDTILSGITRSKVIEAASYLGIKCREIDIRIDQLRNCDFAFLTGTAIEIKKIKEIKHVERGVTYQFSNENEIFNLVRELYKKLI
ncbi:Branched-chain-amino-acid aminotransferase [Candidatus Cyrtobacter comes]|uniref:Probable branched-chain-amino-acid aminotransferase n=1 Tax=Candidatus Cyrtobacter comes TaxID=675776 RepID=A0ABU5L7X6_9RICK|nr:aminotransferase class IV [Candidatus Cyrtobacter comes]MDZ5762005.1 Branched-chain-amino-acid aminotransferase [Candidatus Cyrtobacter comes]